MTENENAKEENILHVREENMVSVIVIKKLLIPLIKDYENNFETGIIAYDDYEYKSEINLRNHLKLKNDIKDQNFYLFSFGKRILFKGSYLLWMVYFLIISITIIFWIIV